MTNGDKERHWLDNGLCLLSNKGWTKKITHVLGKKSLQRRANSERLLIKVFDNLFSSSCFFVFFFRAGIWVGFQIQRS